MLTIYKYPLEVAAMQTIPLPIGATILHFANQFETPVVWALVDTEAPTEYIVFHMVGTGHRMPNSYCVYIGSAQFQGGEFVWHLFRVAE